MTRIRLANTSFTVLLVLALCLGLSAQSSKSKPQTPAKPTFTPQQKIALEMLDQQAGVAKGLAPVMHSFALLEISQGYQKLEPPKALAALHDAFQASQAIPDDSDPHSLTKQYLQTQIISRLVALDPAYCEQLVPQLAGPARKTAIGELVNHYTSKKQFSRAVALLSQLGDQEFPYAIGSRLMQVLPPEMAADKQNLFSQALASYSQHAHKDQFFPDDIDVVIARNWQGLPPGLVLQAVDEVLRQARDADTKLQITVGAAKGAASFNSIYEYKLFELMPVLRALDPERADRLLQENRDLQSTVKQFPNGLQSLDPGQGAPDSISMRTPNGGGGSAAGDRYAAELQQRVREIVAAANKDPKQALAATMSLPDFHDTRAMAMLQLADTLLHTAPGYASDALAELMKIIPSVQREMAQSDLLAGAGQDYLKLGDTDTAKKVVDRGFKLAENLYASDTDAGDPNQASKVEWPSTSVWCRFVTLAARISPQTALQAISGIPDPEIQSLETITLANSLLGTPSGPVMVSMQSKSKQYQFSSAPDPSDEK